MNFDTLEDWKLFENDNSRQEKCMLFIMKNNIKPIWEDSNNCKLVLYHIKSIQKMYMMFGKS